MGKATIPEVLVWILNVPVDAQRDLANDHVERLRQIHKKDEVRESLEVGERRRRRRLLTPFCSAEQQ